jgi:hypothetical protein
MWGVKDLGITKNQFASTTTESFVTPAFGYYSSFEKKLELV